MSLTPKGNFLVAGNNPNANTNLTVQFPSEFRVEILDPPFMSVARPKILDTPKKIGFNQQFTVPVSIPSELDASKIQGVLPS